MKVVTFGEIMLRLGAPDYLRLNQCNQFDPQIRNRPHKMTQRSKR